MRPEKQQLAQDIRQLIEPSAFVFLISYQGLEVDDFEALRTSLGACEAECHVVPNRMFRHAVQGTGAEILAELQLRGETAMVTGTGDAVAVAKALSDFMKDKEGVTVKGGSLDGRSLGPDGVGQLSKLPPREVLLAQLLGVLNGPARNLVGVLTSAKSGIVYALQAYLNSKEDAA